VTSAPPEHEGTPVVGTGQGADAGTGTASRAPDEASPRRTARQVLRLRVTTRSIVLAVLAITLTLLGLRVAASATRVFGWVLAATVVAGLLHPVVALLSRRMPRALALAVVSVGVLALAGVVAWGVIDDLTGEVRRLQEVLPEAARELEQSERFGEPAREFRLAERTQAFVEELPNWLQGGSGAEALRANATRGVAFLATGVLTLFLLVHGPRLLASGLAQVHDDTRRLAAADLLARSYRRAVRYLGGQLARAAMAGLFTYALLSMVGLHGERVLALTVAVTSMLPYLGILIGAAPIALLAFGTEPFEDAVALGVLFVGYQALDALVFQRWVDRRSIHVGPAVTVLVAILGLSLYGIGGVFVSLALAVFAVSFADELAPTDEHEVPSSADELLAAPDEPPPPEPDADADTDAGADPEPTQPEPAQEAQEATSTSPTPR